MGTLKEQLQSDLTDAMRARDQVRTGSLRMALSAVTTEEVAGKEHRDLTDDDVLKVLGREAKKRREASEAYAGADRPELAAQEDAELAVLETYLPKQLSDDELSGIVTDAVGSSGATGMAQMGLAMKAANAAVAGRAEGGRVAAIVKRTLAGR
ncbi:MAG: GatB/YqeY domain-containing protein [Terracoccus sp.]